MRFRNSASWVLSLTAFAALSIGPPAAHGQCELAKFLAPGGKGGDLFGTSVAISGDLAIVGAPSVDEHSGAVYAYQQDGSTWVYQQTLTVPDRGTEFGHSVATDGTVIVVGAFEFRARGAGRAYVFRFVDSRWTQVQKLTAFDGVAGDFFGHSVGVFDDLIVVGANGDDEYSGSAYVYRFNGGAWALDQKLTGGGGPGPEFGKAVGISGDAILIGADWAHWAWVFRRNEQEWIEEQRLTVEDDLRAAKFGHTVAISNDVAVIGAPLVDGTGAAYAFRRKDGNWIEEAKLLAHDGQRGDLYAWWVDVDGDAILVGSVWHKELSGSAYLYRYIESNWVQTLRLRASDAEPGNRFGNTVGISGDMAVIGSPQDDDIGEQSGSVYFFDLDDFCVGDLNCDGSVDLRDVDPFLVALLDPDEYAKQHPDCDIKYGDTNTDGSVDLVDVEGFIAILLG